MRRMASIHHMSRSLYKDIMSDLRCIFKKQFNEDLERFMAIDVKDYFKREKPCFAVEVISKDRVHSVKHLFFRVVFSQGDWYDLPAWSNVKPSSTCNGREILDSFISMHSFIRSRILKSFPSLKMMKLCCGCFSEDKHKPRFVFPAECGAVDDELIESLVKFKLILD